MKKKKPNYKPFDDEDFKRDTGQRTVPLTKRETRLLVLSLMEIEPSDIFLDIGGGTGGIALEAARIAHDGRVYCIEKDLDAYQIIKENQKKLGLKNVHVIYGIAPKGLNLYDKMQFNRIFIGGSSLYLDEVVKWSSTHLTRNGKIGATFTSIEHCYECIQEFRRYFDNIEIINLNVAKSKIVHNLTMFKPSNPVFILVAERKK